MHFGPGTGLQRQIMWQIIIILPTTGMTCPPGTSGELNSLGGSSFH